MSEHTPGPWRACEVFPSIVIGSDGKRITLPATSRDDDVNEANANLIAAAPEMLEVLELCDEAMAYMSEYDIPLTLPDKVKSAIAKAKGEL